LLPAPDASFGLMPFWFWNDALDESELARQIDDFAAHGVTGFVIHPRVGLPEDIGWMSDRMLGFVRFAVEQAARRGMKVILYDEGMYPSGSSNGQVVASNPAFACRGLVRVLLPSEASPKLEAGWQLLSIALDHAGQRFAVIEGPIAAVIRGLHYVGEGPAEQSPPAADLLNPAATQRFIALVYDRYAACVGDHFGSTVLGIFTDEPSLIGRPCESNVRPGTAAVLHEAQRLFNEDFRPHLLTLWDDQYPDATLRRRQWKQACRSLLERTYYRPLHDWCTRHGLWLMGHPEGPDDYALERYFHAPGQDLVWRWVMPDEPTALEGPQSTQAKCASSAMLHQGKQRNSNEFCGAYGHELTFEQMQWLANWCFVRGTNLMIPHAFYYSVRGPRRDERPPDVGPNSPWWSRFGPFAAHCRRMCWLNTDMTHVCDVAIYGHGDELPWRAAKVCYESQIDFNYLDDADLHAVTIDAAGVRIAGMTYRAVVVDHDVQPPAMLAERLRAAGVLVHYDRGDADSLRKTLSQKTARVPLVQTSPALRVRQVRKGGQHFLILFNEVNAPCTAALAPHEAGWFELDTTRSESRPVAAGQPLQLAPHAMRVFHHAVR